jgi:hypothetical protein
VYVSTIILFFFFFLLSALQLFVSFSLLDYFFPLFPLLRPLFPIGHSHLPQIIPHIVFLGLPFVLVAYGFHLHVVLATLYMPQPAQSLLFYVSYYIFVIDCFFQFFICFESPHKHSGRGLSNPASYPDGPGYTLRLTEPDVPTSFRVVLQSLQADARPVPPLTPLWFFLLFISDIILLSDAA